MKKLGFGGFPGRVRGTLLVFVGIICSAGLLLAANLAAGAAPRVVAPQTSFDFGKVFEDRPLIHTFIIKNEGNAPLRVEYVDPDCACTVAEYDPLIPPGGKGQINLEIKPYTVMRDFIKTAKVTLNDPDKPELTLSLKGYVQPIIEIQPSHIIRFKGTATDDMRGQVRFISHLSQPWQITRFVNNLTGKVEVKVQAEKPGKVYVVQVRNLDHEPGHYGGTIYLYTSSKERPRMLVRVFANIYPSASAPGGP